MYTRNINTIMLKVYLKEWCNKRGTTQKEVAKVIGVTEGTMANISRGNVMPSLNTLEALAEHLHITPNELFALPHEEGASFAPVIQCPHCGKLIHIEVSKR